MDKRYNNRVLQEDIGVIADELAQFKALYSSTILVTGATGLIGSLIVKGLLAFTNKFMGDITVIAVVRNVKKAEEGY